MRPESSPSPGSGLGVGTSAVTVTPAGFVGRYQILERIGEGGMGALFLARDPVIERLIAIKVLRRGHDNADLRERFLREGRAAGRLRHPHIVTIFDVGEHDGDPFIAMEFLAGETLADLIRQGARLALTRRLKLLEELCDGLAYAHRAGMVHRDIKPANLMVDADGTLKILDFGIVRVGESGMTEAGALVGTINYMSPEQINGEPINHRSDIFAVGLVAYEFISSRQAFPGTIGDGLFSRILNVTIEPLSSVAPGLDPAVVSILSQALQRDPAARYQDLVRMRNDLNAARLRLELVEERAATAAGASAGVTAVVSTPVPSSVNADGTVRTVRGDVPAKPSALIDAERALATGNYRAALTLAGRSAVEGAPHAEASAIVQRAHSALLEQGRRLEKTGPIAERVPALTTSASAAGRRTGTWIAMGVAVVALLAAGAAYFMQPEVTPERSPAGPGTPPPAQSQGPVVAPPPKTAETATPPDTPVQPPPSKPTPEEKQAGPTTKPLPNPPKSPTGPRGASGAPGTSGPPPRAPIIPVRVGVNGVPPPTRIRRVDPEMPPEALAAAVQGTVELQITISADGDVADATVTRSIPLLDRAAVQAVMKWQYAPTLVDGKAVPVIHTVQVPFTIDAPREREAAPPLPPPPSKPTPVDPTPPRSAEPEPRPPALPDPGQEETAIRQQLRNYAAAWKALDLGALQQVQLLSGPEVASVQRTIEQAQSYEVVVTVESVKIDGARAQVRAQITRRFQPKSGRGSNVTAASTIEMQKQGDRWVIVRFR